MNAPDQIIALGHAFRASRTLLSAVELGVFTALAKEPLDANELRNRLRIAARGAPDFFDALVALGMLKRDSAGRYANTSETDQYLDRDKPSYIGGELEHYGAYVYPHWSGLTEALRSGSAQSGERARGHYPAFYSDPDALARFARGMTGGTLSVAKAIADRFDWRPYRSFIDIGTAQGVLPVVIALRYPHLTGGGFDLPPMQPHFEAFISEHGLGDRLRFMAGDFFKDELPSADVMVLGRVLHNWDLASKQMLLRKAYAALPPGGALIVHERLIDDERRANAAALLASLNMLIMTEGGFDFTAADGIAWLRDAGFKSVEVQTLIGEHSMITGVK